MIRTWGSCITCHWCGDIAEKDENGKPKEPVWKNLKPYCEYYKQVLPGYDHKPGFCTRYSMSAEYREKYEDRD